MAWRYRPAMDSNARHQAPEPDWTQQADARHDVELLRQRNRELEEQVRSYEALLNELPELFERKFQQRLEPLLERYRLLAERASDAQAGKPILMEGASDNVVRFPLPRIPSLLRRRQTSA